jgi:hypothetical protein
MGANAYALKRTCMDSSLVIQEGGDGRSSSPLNPSS